MATRPKVKVRTGCLTCKSRKVKCDEFRPLCRRCTSSGRMCEGYADPANTSQTLAPPHGRFHALVRSSSQPKVDWPLSQKLTGDERQWLGYFCSRTGPALSGSLDKRSFWSLELPQLSLSEPAIRHALLAVSSCHARYETQLVRGKQRDDGTGRDFTLKHYSLAIVNLQNALEQQSTNLEVFLVCCLLFICLECLFGNTNLTLTHLQNGLKIINTRHSYKGGRQTLKSIAEKLESIFDNLEAQSTVFGVSTGLVARPPRPMDFTDAFTAKASLDILVSTSMRFVKYMRIDYGSHQHPDIESKRLLQRDLLDQFLAWETRMQFLEQNDSTFVNSNDASVMILHLRQHATFVYVATCLDPRQTYCDAFLPHFKAIIDLADQFLACKNRDDPLGKLSPLASVFSLESSMIPALYLTAIRCREPDIRHHAVHLLEAHPGREGFWDARLYAKAARRVVEIEEGDLAIGKRGSFTWPDEASRVYRTDVLRISEEPARSAKLIFYTAPNGSFGDKVSWSELVAF